LFSADRLNRMIKYAMFHPWWMVAPMIDAAVVGLGRWGKSIVESVQGKSKRLRFVRGVCKEPKQLDAFVATHGLEVGVDFAHAIADPAVQAVVLATPHLLHVDQIIEVARIGKPVWCEKPLALTRSEAERAVAACRDAGVILGLGNNKRCFASMRELKKIVVSGVLGDILHLEGHFCNEHSTRVAAGWRDDPAQAPGGGMTGAGLHILDAFVNLAGPVAEVDARLFVHKPAPDPRDAIAALLQFKSGATGLLATVRAAPSYWRVHVFGTRGWAEARDEAMLTVARNGEKPQQQVLPQVDSLAVLLEAFAESVEMGKPFPVSTSEMLEVVSIFEAIIRSANQSRPVPVARA
jgi:predicted dehydrogenase